MTGDEHEGTRSDLPPVRIDWLGDVAWRLAALGLSELRRCAQGTLTLDDQVDGLRWRAQFMLDLIEPLEGVVDLDADLWAPGDPDGTPSLRLGAALTPVIDEAGERAVQVRLEIGPRAAVTFDPENWIFTLPLEAVRGGERPLPSGVTSAPLQLDPRSIVGQAGSSPDLQAAASVALGDLIELAEGRASWTAVIGLLAAAPKRGLLGRLSRDRAEPYAALTLESTGPLTITDPAGVLTGDGPERRPVGRLTTDAEQVVLEVDGDGGEPAQIAISGPHLQTRIWLLSGAPQPGASAPSGLA